MLPSGVKSHEIHSFSLVDLRKNEVSWNFIDSTCGELRSR